MPGRDKGEKWAKGWLDAQGEDNVLFVILSGLLQYTFSLHHKKHGGGEKKKRKEEEESSNMSH